MTGLLVQAIRRPWGCAHFCIMSTLISDAAEDYNDLVGRLDISCISFLPISQEIEKEIKPQGSGLVHPPTASGGLHAEVQKNNSLLVFWHDPPKIDAANFLIKVWETQLPSNMLYEYVPASNSIGLLFKNLKAYTNYSVTVTDYQSGKWVALAAVSSHTFPKQPDAPSFSGSTADTLVVTIPQNWPNFFYTAEVLTAESDSLPSRRTVACNATANACRFEGLRPNTGYRITLQNCSQTDPLLCSQKSDESHIFYTKPKEPRNLVLTNITSTSITAIWMSPKSNNQTISKFTVTAVDAVGNGTSQIVPSISSHYTFEDLQPTTWYRVSVIACARNDDCGLPAEATAWTLPQEPSNLHVYATGKGQLACEWQPPSKRNIVDGYQLSLHDGVGFTLQQRKDFTATQLHTVLANLSHHRTYHVNLRACFKATDTGKSICSQGVNAAATTNPDPLPFTIADRTATSLDFHFTPYGGDREHFNYTLMLKGREEKFACDATKARCQVNGLPANSKIEASLVTCCKHRLCSLQSDLVAYTKPLPPLDLQMGSPTDTTIYASWNSPQPTTEPITGYRAVAVDTLGGETSCTPSRVSKARLHCTFRHLSPCMPYHISVQTCARDDDCSLKTTGKENTLPGTVSGFQMQQRTSTNMSFTWTPQSMEACALDNITVTVQGEKTNSIVSHCSVKQLEAANNCTVTGLEPNTAYTAYAVACSATTHNCAYKTTDIEVETLPGVPLQINMSEVAARSVVLKWSQPSGRQDGLSGFLVRVYERSQDGRRSHGHSVSNCTTTVVDVVDDVNTCRVDDLQPSTNYSITATTFKRHPRDGIIYGDESEAIDFTTCHPFPIMAVTVSLLFVIVIGLLFAAFLFRHQLRKLASRLKEKDNTTDMSQPPAPVAFQQLDACIESLDSNKQFISHFMLLKKIAVTGVENEFHLTKNAGLQRRELNRYIDMLPYDQSIVILGRRWPRILDDPEPKITTTELLNNYINASYIRRPIFGMKGEAMPCDPSDPPNYIATQGPMSTTAADFLTMVYEQRSKLILMLCRCEEDGKQKCKEYWDDECELMVTSATRSVKVTTSNVHTLNFGLVRRTLCIMPTNKTEPWYVTQFHFTQWPDCEAADMTAFYNLINLHMKFIRENPVNRSCGPPVVHCSAGVGRTGTLIAASYLLERLRAYPEKMDIFGTTLAIRRWRPNMVQTWFENITFVDCFNGYAWIQGVLQITHAHTFFVDNSKKHELR
uniref:Protein-tyrosine-phosphatase n=1 Tax=Echinococcus canadensis TaxID=519352 RepID=A0A915ETC3_9CEST